ncbi:MAG: sulfatase [Planctomycetota bacterium]
MNRRHIAILVLLLGPALPLFMSCSRPPVEGPDVIVILVDTLRRDALGCYGNPRDPTPAIDRFARESTRFKNAISPSGWTLPAVASLLTGTWPSIHRAQGKVSRLTPLSPDVTPCTVPLQAAGYRTLAVANAAFLSPLLGLDRGFDVFDHRHAYNQEIRGAAESVDRALALLDLEPDHPAFLLLHLFDPHLDYDPPEDPFRFTGGRTEPPPPLGMKACGDLCMPEDVVDPEAVEYVRAIYLAEVACVDRQVGRFLDELKRRGRYDEALVILLADHGEEFFEHGDFEHGHTLYDELIKVPLLVKWPEGRGPVPGAVAKQVPTLDLMPTVFDVLGLDTPASCVGRSLLETAWGGERTERLLFSEATLYGPEKMSLRTGRREKVIVTYVREGPPVIEIYDLRKDPLERVNLAPTSPELVERLGGQIRDVRQRLTQEGARNRVGSVQDLDPKKSAEYLKSLDSLGYTRGSKKND